MKNLLLIALLLLASSLPAKEGGRALRLVSETTRAPNADYAQEVPFAFRGTVLFAACDKQSLLFEDATGRAKILFEEAPARPDLVAGDVVEISGRLALSRCRERMLYALSWRRLAHRDPAPPVDLTIAQIVSGAGHLRPVRTVGRVVEAFRDDVDALYSRLVLYADGLSIDMAVQESRYPLDALQRLVDAEVRITGACTYKEGWRGFSPPFFNTVTEIEVLKPAPADPFDLETLQDPDRSLHSSNPCGSRRRTEGLVLAVWQGSRVLLQAADGFLVRLFLATGTPPPACGASVVAAGLVDTDGTNLLLQNARWKPGTESARALPEPDLVKASALFLDESGNRAIQYYYDGRAVRLRGRVLAADAGDARLILESDGFTLPVDASGLAAPPLDVQAGSRVEVSGICLIDFETWRRGAPFPHVRGMTVIVNSPTGLQVLAGPPGLSRRLVLAFAGLIAVLVAILLWNLTLHRLVDQKAHGLLRAQLAKAESELRLGERTRLAAELHDYTCQNLTAVSYQVSAARRAQAVGSADLPDILDTVARMLRSCIVELRRCLWDLRNDALDQPNFAESIRQTIASVSQGAAVTIVFSLPHAQVGESMAHAVLSILRELVANAVRHGKATRIRIAGAHEGGRLLFSVTDNGCGFDPAARPGQEDGCFGLAGVAERAKRFGGSLSVRSVPGRGTRASVTMRLPAGRTKGQNP